MLNFDVAMLTPGIVVNSTLQVFNVRVVEKPVTLISTLFAAGLLS